MNPERSGQQTKQSHWGFRGKTVWDWLDLLLVPLVLGLGAVFLAAWFNAQQDTRQQRLENQRAEAERALAAHRAQDEALQAYLDQMSTLLLEKDLWVSGEDSEVRTLARARTLTVLERLDPSRKTAVATFLAEAKLIGTVFGKNPVIALNDADLSGADLNGADLYDAELNGADLHGADLSDVVLIGADLSDAELSGAVLSDANMFMTKLFMADLRGADLSGAGLSGANLGGADLSDADLRDADLGGADLSDADLSDADLSDADLGGYDPDTGGAHRGVIKDQFAQAKSLEGTTMPNGQKYEDWLKDSEGGKEDEKNQ